MKPNRLRFTETEDGYRCLFREGDFVLNLDIAGDRPLEDKPETWAYELFVTREGYCDEPGYCTTGEVRVLGDEVVPCAACEFIEEVIMISLRDADEPLPETLVFVRRELAEGGEGLAHLAVLPWVVDESGKRLA